MGSYTHRSSILAAVRRTRRRIAMLAAVLAAAALTAALVPGVAHATGTLDQQQTSCCDAFSFTDKSAAQTFTAGLSGALDQVDLALVRPASTAGPLTVEIRDVLGFDFAPSTTVLASASVPATSVPALPAPTAFVAVPFASPPPVVTGTQYAIVAYSVDRYVWGGNSGNPYPSGTAWESDVSPPSTWQELATFDAAFKTYVTTSSGQPPGQDKVTICHKPGTPQEKTMQVPPPALAVHKAHGDTEGPC